MDNSWGTLSEKGFIDGLGTWGVNFRYNRSDALTGYCRAMRWGKHIWWKPEEVELLIKHAEYCLAEFKKFYG